MNQRYRRHTLRTTGSSRTLSTLVAVGLLLGTVVGTCASHGRVAVPPGAGRVLRPQSASAVKMSWRCHGTDNRSMVRALVQNKIVTQESVAAAMTGTDRGDFVADKRSAYVDAPQYIGYDATISAPHMHAFALENLAGHLKPGAKALDVGSGSGYLSVAMALMVGDKGKVYGIEHVPELNAMSIASTKKHHADLLTSGRLDLSVVDGFDGLPSAAPFDAIHVGAAAPHIPKALLQQLAPGGRIFIPVGPANGDQVIVQVDKSEDGERITKSKLMAVRYVPLVQNRGKSASSAGAASARDDRK